LRQKSEDGTANKGANDATDKATRSIAAAATANGSEKTDADCANSALNKCSEIKAALNKTPSQRLLSASSI
jgi:hypothetical protein